MAGSQSSLSMQNQGAMGGFTDCFADSQTGKKLVGKVSPKNELFEALDSFGEPHFHQVSSPAYLANHFFPAALLREQLSTRLDPADHWWASGHRSDCSGTKPREQSHAH